MNRSFQNCKTFSESIEPLPRNRDPNITQNEHFNAICSRPEVAGDVISGNDVMTVEGYALLKFEAANISGF